MDGHRPRPKIRGGERNINPRWFFKMVWVTNARETSKMACSRGKIKKVDISRLKTQSTISALKTQSTVFEWHCKRSKRNCEFIACYWALSIIFSLKSLPRLQGVLHVANICKFIPPPPLVPMKIKLGLLKRNSN